MLSFSLVIQSLNYILYDAVSTFSIFGLYLQSKIKIRNGWMQNYEWSYLIAVGAERGRYFQSSSDKKEIEVQIYS